MSYLPHIVSRTLPASGAYYTDATPLALRGSWGANTGDVARIAVLITYTRGASGGYPKFRPVWSFAGASTINARDTAYSGTSTVSSGEVQADLYRAAVLMKNFSDLSSAESAVVVLDVPPGATHLKIEPAEVGVTATPGTIVVDIDGEV